MRFLRLPLMGSPSGTYTGCAELHGYNPVLVSSAFGASFDAGSGPIPGAWGMRWRGYVARLVWSVRALFAFDALYMPYLAWRIGETDDDFPDAGEREYSWAYRADTTYEVQSSLAYYEFSPFLPAETRLRLVKSGPDGSYLDLQAPAPMKPMPPWNSGEDRVIHASYPLWWAGMEYTLPAPCCAAWLRKVATTVLVHVTLEARG